MSKEFEPSESRSGLRTDLETLEAIRTGLFENIWEYYFCPDDVKYADVADSQLALARHFGDTLATIYYLDGMTTYDKFDLIRDLQINEDTARVDFLNFLVDDHEFNPAKVPELDDRYPEGVLFATPEQVDFEKYKSAEIDIFIEYTNADMRAVLVSAIQRCAIDSYRRLEADT